MKKATQILMSVLFVLTILYPAGVIITACLGYSFELISVSAFAIAIAALSLCIVVLDIICKGTHENKATQIMSAITTPLSLINAVFYILECPQIWVVASVLFSAGCCCYLTVKYGKSLSLKIIALILILPIGFFSFIALIFGSIGQNTVVQTAESPSGKYYAQVVDSDQGALGGDTLVVVYQKRGINALLLKFKRNLKESIWVNGANSKICRFIGKTIIA